MKHIKYLGILSPANQHALNQAVKNAYWVRTESANFQKPKDPNPMQVQNN